jgi:hypothetical protein
MKKGAVVLEVLRRPPAPASFFTFSIFNSPFHRAPKRGMCWLPSAMAMFFISQ